MSRLRITYPSLVWSLFLVVWIIIGGGQTAQAESVDFTVQPVFPENQRDDSLMYFDLRVKPGETQKVEFEIKNTGDKPLKIKTSVRSAVTSVYGEIDYKELNKDTKFSKTLDYPFNQLATMEPIITVKAKETIKVPLEIRVPKEEFSGMIAGSVHFSEDEEDENQASDEVQGNMGVVNKFAYQYSVILTENDQAVTADLDVLEVNAQQINRRNVINVLMENKEPLILSDMEIHAQVFKGGSKAPMYESIDKQKRMAPNSYYAYPISLGDKAFQSGKYRLYMTVVSKEGKWEFNRSFEITKKQAQEYNENSALQLSRPINWWLISACIVIALLIIALVIMAIMMKRKKKVSSRGGGRASKSNLKDKGNGHSSSGKNSGKEKEKSKDKGGKSSGKKGKR